MLNAVFRIMYITVTLTSLVADVVTVDTLKLIQ